jgi:CDP-glycerol glycerophosphotransferase (TagB/SpsB family)
MKKEKDNLNKYNKKRAQILLKGIIPSIISFFISKDEKRIILTSTRNEYFNYNSKYFFEYLIKEHPEYEVKFVINDDKKREELNNKYGKDKHYFIETKSLKGMFYALKAKYWFTSALETPVGGFFLKINRIVTHLGHGAYFRSAVFLENNLPIHKKIYYHLIKNNFTYHLITSKKIAEKATKMFGCKKDNILISGEPMNDKLFNPDKKLFKEKYGEDIFEYKNILYAPTWRQKGDLKLFPFDDLKWSNNWNDFVSFLEENKINIFIRLHPSYEDQDLSFYTKKTKNIKILNTQVVEDINEILGLFDLLITDYSSIFTGYLMLNKPVLFLPYDFKGKKQLKF